MNQTPRGHADRTLDAVGDKAGLVDHGVPNDASGIAVSGASGRSVDVDTRPTASLSIDLDNQWAYLRAAGRSDWQRSASYLPEAVDRIVDHLGDLGLPLTVFTVGRDCDNDRDADAIASLSRLPEVEFANHSQDHLPWLHTLPAAELQNQIQRSHASIERCTGQTPIGFRGPGFSCPPAVLRCLDGLGYAYDASTFPTSMAPIARAVFLARTQLQGEELERAKKLYGGFAAMRRPNRPHRIDVESSKLWELPVTVMPFSRTPVHFSYLLFLASFSKWAAKAYFTKAMTLCRWTSTPPSLLLHPPDFMGCDDEHDLAHMPGMKMPRSEKLEFLQWALQSYRRTFRVTTMRRWLSDQTGGVIEAPAPMPHEHGVSVTTG